MKKLLFVFISLILSTLIGSAALAQMQNPRASHPRPPTAAERVVPHGNKAIPNYRDHFQNHHGYFPNHKPQPHHWNVYPHPYLRPVYPYCYNPYYYNPYYPNYFWYYNGNGIWIQIR